MAFAQNNSPKFAIYLLPDNFQTSQLSKFDLKKLKPKGAPIIAQDEIRFYQKETHEFGIDYTAAQRLKKLQSRGCCKPFAVFVGDQAIYAGAFWKSTSSQSFDGIVIDTLKAFGNPPYYSNTNFPVLTLELGYPSPQFFEGADLRADSRIFTALQEAEKLYEKLELVVKCKKIVATGKRRASAVFTFEIVEITRGEFDEKALTLELYDGKMLPELDARMDLAAGGNIEFNPDREIILRLSKQVGKPKPGWFLKGYEKK